MTAGFYTATFHCIWEWQLESANVKNDLIAPVIDSTVTPGLATLAEPWQYRIRRLSSLLNISKEQCTKHSVAASYFLSLSLSPVSMRNVSNCRSYQLSLININSMSNLMASQHFFCLLLIWELSQVSAKLFYRVKESRLCNTTVKLSILFL